MAAAQLNFNEAQLDTSSALYNLYLRLYQGMRAANQVDAPDYANNPPLTEQGEIDTEAIANGLAGYSDILMKNSAYLFADSIVSVIGTGGGSGGGSVVVPANCLSKNGDSMIGKLTALYGFEAGVGDTKVFDVFSDNDNNKHAKVYGTLDITGDADIAGHIKVGNDGIYFGTQAIFADSDTLTIKRGNITLDGNVDVQGNFTLGDLTISSNGIVYGENEFYHNGNLNISTVDFVAKDGHFYGDMQIDGELSADGTTTFLYGFQLGEFGTPLLYSVQDSIENELASLHLDANLHLQAGKSIQFNNAAILSVIGGDTPHVTLAAPGMSLHLGSNAGGSDTTRILLQSGLYNYSGDYRIISSNGDGNFPNSFSAGCANSGPTVMQTYYINANDCGVVFEKNIRLGSNSGPLVQTNANGDTFALTLPYTITNNNVESTEHIGWQTKCIATTSLFKDVSQASSATLQFSTDAEFFQFAKPIEVSGISIISARYKTKLGENTLIFNDNAWFEGLNDGILHNGNAYYNGNLSSPVFTSGFAGSGWCILIDALTGSTTATFDEITIRKKMRVYELEFQKINITNGSLWVSDSCSGDIVEEIL